MLRGSLHWSPLAVLLVAAIGCGGSKQAAVTGEVTLAGRPVEGGTINFIPAGDTTALPAWGKIEAGRYSIPADQGPALGSNRVEIHWIRKTGRKIRSVPPAPPGEMEEKAEVIPARYNSRSELEVQVQQGENTFDFKLESR